MANSVSTPEHTERPAFSISAHVRGDAKRKREILRTNKKKSYTTRL